LNSLKEEVEKNDIARKSLKEELEDASSKIIDLEEELYQSK